MTHKTWSVLVLFVCAGCPRTAPPTVSVPQPAAKTWSTMNAKEREAAVRAMTVAQVPEQSLDPAAFLESLGPYNRNELFAVLSDEQRVQLRSVRTTRALFELLDEDQRVALFLDIGSDLHAGPVSLGLAGLGSTALKKKGIKQKVPKLANPFDPGPLSRKNCYLRYDGDLKVERDGSPCIYGPAACGSTALPGRTPFCATLAAEEHGCGALTQTPGVADCGKSGSTGVPLEWLCNGTDTSKTIACHDTHIAPATFTSVVTDCDFPTRPSKRCITDTYVDPLTKKRVQVPERIDGSGQQCRPCVQQSEPKACGGVDCPCPGLYISKSAFARPGAFSNPMNPTHYTNGVLIPFVSLPDGERKKYKLEYGTLVLVSSLANPTEDPKDWVAGVFADVGSTERGEVSYAMWDALGRAKKAHFRVYPKHRLPFPATRPDLDALKVEAMKLCCPGDQTNPCHQAQGRGECITDKADPLVGECRCKNGWLPGADGDCNAWCAGSDATKESNWTWSKRLECNGQGSCRYGKPDAVGDLLGTCECEPGAWHGTPGLAVSPGACKARDCVDPVDWENLDVEACYGHGQCNPAASATSPGTCTCDDGWANETRPTFSAQPRIAPCVKKVCPKDCSGNGKCDVDAAGEPFCSCRAGEGWWGPACDKRGCVTTDGRVCSGHGECVGTGKDEPKCLCTAEWGGGLEKKPDACQRRQCKDCPEGVARCTYSLDPYLFGGEDWRCDCDNGQNPPTCSSGSCCSGFWGTCNEGLKGQGAGGGTCIAGKCECAPGYDPGKCCGELLTGAAPPGFGGKCDGVSKRTITLTCPPVFASCDTCNGFGGMTQVLAPNGTGMFTDIDGNAYQLDESSCRLKNIALGAGSIGVACKVPIDQGMWLAVNGLFGHATMPSICGSSCKVCPQVPLNCTAKLK